MRKPVVVAILNAILAVGCATQPEDTESDVVAVEDDAIGPQTAVTYGGFTLNATSPSFRWNVVDPNPYSIMNSWMVRSWMTVSGGSGTSPMGVCALRRYGNRPCSVAAECADLPILPGGYRYCAQAQGTAGKVCMVRPGAASTYCAGTPANGVRIGNGTYSSPEALAGLGSMAGEWVSYGCYAGCVGTEPTVSTSYPVAP
jgi:hypothetical protein